MSFLEGRVVLDPVDPLDWAAQLAGTLHSIHGIRTGPDDGALFPTIDSDDRHSSEEVVKRHPLGLKLWEARLEAVGSLVPEERVYAHHDYWPGNTLWIDETLVAVVDWEGGCIADPALDVAYCALDLRLLGLDDAAEHFVECLPRGLRTGSRQPPLLGAHGTLPSDARHRAVGAGLAGDGDRHHRRGCPGTACAPDRNRPGTGLTSPHPVDARRGETLTGLSSPVLRSEAQLPKASSKSARNSGVLTPLNPQ